MTQTLHDIELQGCAPTPLAHYLKALGILRLVSEQIPDSQAKGWWQNDTFWLRSTLDREQLVEFFLNRYAPSPIVGPWGARSGFFQGSSERTARIALERIATSEQKRLSLFQMAIREVTEILNDLGLDQKADSDDDKLNLLIACRNRMSDELLDWLDAVYMLTANGRAFPPLLGTGGNEGSGSYMSGFSQQVVSVICNHDWDHAIASSLFDEANLGIMDQQTPGHFFPDAAGGPNSESGFTAKTSLNPWDYLLAIEGSLMFAAAAVKRLEDHSDGSLAYPFCVRPAGVGYGTSSLSDEISGRAEMWFPVWTDPTSVHELNTLFSEGRAIIQGRKPSTGIDFARSVASLGTDRGISSFCRYGFHQRNGLSNFAIPLGDFHVTSTQTVTALLEDPQLDRWLAKLRRAATSNNASASAGRALRAVESAILKLCQRGNAQDVQQLLIALGHSETTIANSPKLREGEKGSGLQPVPLLSKQWLDHLSENSTIEFRLAAALASVWHGEVGPIRKHVEPIDCDQLKRQRASWLENANSPSIVWTSGDLIRNMNAVLKRRLIEVMQVGKQKADEELFAPVGGRYFPGLDDISAFINGQTDDQRIVELFKGLMLLKWSDCSARDSVQDNHDMTDATYALLKLCFLDRSDGATSVKLQPQIAYRAMAGHSSEATQLAARRLRSSGIPPAIECVHVAPDRMQRIAAALLFPISTDSANLLKQSVLAKHLIDKQRSDIA